MNEMIDTDKYEGHLAYLDYELWAFTDFMDINATHEERCATDALLNDAPLLLEEVKRLKAKLFEAELWVNNDSYTFENSIKELNDYMEMIE
jgi:hypothetical protein